MTDDRRPDDDDIGNDATMAPPADDGTGETMAAPVADVGTNATLQGAPPAPRLPGRRQRRTSGGSLAEEMRGATVERLHEVARDEYEVMGEFARGGLGRIFRARDHRSGRVVAIKEVLRADGDIVVRFAREALVTANLQHPSIVPVYEVGRWPSGEPFFAMKLVSGKSLDELVKSATSTAERLALLPHVIDVADALAYAHSEHVIHRDLKPANVLVGAYGETVVIDWGLAKNLETGEEARALPTAPTFDDGRMAHADPTDSSETVAGAVVGTPAYMAPEQARGEPLDERADVYAIGAMLYQILGGERPYVNARTVEEILMMIIEGPPRRLIEFAPELPRELIAIVEKAMAPDPAARYADAKGLAADLRRFSTGQLVAAHQYSIWHLITRWVRANRAVVATASVAIVALALFGAYSVRRIRSERDEASRQRGLAVAARGVAEHRLGEGLEELGRQALTTAAPERALPFFANAYAAQSGGPAAMHELAGRGLAAYEALSATVVGDGGVTSVDLGVDRKTIFVASVVNGVAAVLAIDVATGATNWKFPNGERSKLSPDGKAIFVMAPNAFSIVNSSNGHVESTWRMHADGGESDVRSVESLEWSADGTMVAAGEDDGTLVLHDIATGMTTWRNNAAATKVWDVSFSPGKQWIACGSVGAFQFWSVAGFASDAKPEIELPGVKEVMTFNWLDDDRVIVADQSGIATMWSLATKRPIRQFNHGEALYGADMSPDQHMLATFAQNEHVIIWDVATGAKISDLVGGPHSASGVPSVAWIANPDGVWIASNYENGTVRVWDPRRGALLATLPPDEVNVSITSRDRTLVVASQSKRIRIWDTARISNVRGLGNHVGRVRRAIFDAAGKTIFTASADGTAEAIDVATGKVKFTIGAPVAVPDVAWNATTPPPAPNPHGLRWIDLSPNGALFATSAEDGNVSLWRTTDGRLVKALVGHTARVRSVRFAADGKTVVTASADNSVRRWDVETGTQLLRIDGAHEFGDARMSKDGQHLITEMYPEDPKSAVQRVDIWDAKTGAPVVLRGVIADQLRQLQFDGAGDLVVGVQDSTTIVDSVTGAKVHTIIDAFDVAAFDVSHRGAPTIIMSLAGGAISVFDENTGAALRRWIGDPQVVSLIALRADDMVLASSGTDGLVKLWDPADGRLLAQTEQPLPAPPLDLHWSPDGNSVLITSIGGALRLWNVAPYDGTASELTARAACASPWRLEGTTLVPAPLMACTPR